MLNKKETLQPFFNKVYLSINEGQIVRSLNGEKEYFSSIDGFIHNISAVDRVYNGIDTKLWQIDMTDEDENYLLTFPYSSGVFKSIIMCLASLKDIAISTPIRIEPYVGGNSMTKVKVYADGVKLDWLTKNLPPLAENRIGSKVIKDDTERMKFICGHVEQIVARLNNSKK